MPSSMASFHSLSSHAQLSPSPFSRLPQFNPAYTYTYSSPNFSPRQTNFFIPNNNTTLPLSLSPLKNSTFLVTNSYNPMLPPYNVLITGSTKGIGFALAKEFLKAADNVVISSRSGERVENAVQGLRDEFGEQHVWGTTCDVRNGEDVKNLVSFAREKLKYIDIWINNAGSNAYSYKPLAEASDEDLIEVVTTNTLGLMICCREAIKMMANQPRGGHVFNIDGAGSDGRPTPRFAAYGATKRSVVHLTKSLQAELQMQDVKNVMVHNLSKCFILRLRTTSVACILMGNLFRRISTVFPSFLRFASHMQSLLPFIGFVEARRGCCCTGTVATTSLLCNPKLPGTCSNATQYVLWKRLQNKMMPILVAIM